MKLSRNLIKALVKQVICENEFTSEYTEDDMDNARSAEYGLDMLYSHFQQNPADEAARQRVMGILFKIQSA